MPGRPKNVFISYRRDDNAMTVAVLKKALSDRPDIANVFRDIDNIAYGDDFVSVIDDALKAANVVLVIIGPRWVDALKARLGGTDWVRHEVAEALRLRAAGLADPALAATRLHVVPVLIAGAAPPPEDVLPEKIASLHRLSMLSFDEHSEQASINTLLERIQGETFEQKARRLEAEARQRAEQARVEAEQRAVEARRQKDEHEQERQDRIRRVRALLASASAGLALFMANLFSALDYFNIDTRFAGATMLFASLAGRQEAPWSGEVVLVAIDAESERAVGRKFDPSWRSEHAAVIQRAASAAARTVAFDMVLEDPAPAAANASLQEALAAMHDKMPVVFGVQNRGADGNDVMLAQFAALARKGVACAGLALGQAQLMPLAAHRADVPGRRDDTGSSASRAPADAAPQGAEMIPSFALAAYGGGGRVEAVEGTGKLVVRVRPQRRTQSLDFYKVETLESPQPGCDALAAGDKVYSQLIDPYDLPALREAPQRIAYERVLAGDPGALALLKDRIVVVGTMLPGLDRIPMPWPADDRWGVELHAAHVDAIARHVAIRPLRPITEWLLMSGAALLGALVAHRLRERPRVLKIAALVGIALVWIAVSIARYRAERQLIGVPYDIAALALGAWLANRTWRRIPA